MSKLKFILFLFLLLPLCVKPIVLDSLQKEELIKQGVFKLNALKAANLQKIKEGKTSELNFIVNLEPDNTTDYINDNQLNGKGNFLSTPAVEQELNNRLQRVYNNKQKECYLILINAFDVKINAPVPTGLTAQDVFNTGKFFNEQSDIEQQKQFHNDVVTQISNNTISANRNSYVLSCGAYCGAFFQNKVGCLLYWYSLQKADINNPSIPYYSQTYDYLVTYLRNSNDFHKISSKDNIAKQMVTAFENAAINVELKALILQRFTSAEIIDILKQFHSNDDYTTLSIEERLHILSVFVSNNMSGNYSEVGEEGYALKVIAKTPLSDINQLLDGLALASTLNTNINYTGDKTNSDALIYRLISHIDDAWAFGVGGDNYAKFNKILCALVKSSADLSSKQNAVLEANSIDKHVFTWDASYNSGFPPIGAIGYDITLNNNGSVAVSRKYVSGYEGAQGLAVPVLSLQGSPFSLAPFDIILFANNCKLDMINQAGVTQGELVFVPAIFLKYAKDKQFNQTMFNAAVATADVVTIAVAPLHVLKAVTWTRRAWIAFETANAVGNLSINVLGEDLPAEYQDVVNYSNYLMLAVGGQNVIKGGYNSIKNAYTATVNITSGISKQSLITFAQKIQPQLPNLQQLSQQGKQSAQAITKFYERIKIEFKRVFNEDLDVAAVGNMGGFISNSGAELKVFLNTILVKPIGKSYNGTWYRYTGNPSFDPTEIYNGMIDTENRFRKGLYISETKDGNLIEANSYGGTSGKTLYEMTDVQISNILDLTDESIIRELGTSFEQMKLTGVSNSYEFTQEIAIWAKDNGYSGLKFYGAQGGTTDYINFVIFDQSNVNEAIKGTVNIIPW